MSSPPSSVSTGTGTWVWANPFGDVSKAGSIGASTEVDLFRFIPDVSGSYVFGVNGSLDSQLRVYNSSGAAITGVIDSAVAGGSESVTLSLTGGSWYYVAVTGFQTSTGNYTLSINGPTPTATSVPIVGSANTGSANGSIDYGADLDYIVVTAPAGVSSLDLTVTPSSGFDSYVELYSSSGVLLNTIKSGGAGSADTASNIPVNSGATYYVGISGVSSTATGTYSINLDFNPDSSVSDPNDQISDADPLGSMSNDRFFLGGALDNATDVDMFSFSVSAGQRIAFDLDRNSGSLDSYLRLFNSSGTQLSFSDNASAPNELYSTTDSWLQYTFNSAGTYYVGVSNSNNTSYSANGGGGDVAGSTGSYDLHLSVTGGNASFAISGTFADNLGSVFPVSIRNINGKAIDPSKPTWLVIHGWRGKSEDFFTLAEAIQSLQPSAQVLTVDWEDAAAGITNLLLVENRIPYVAAWVATALENHGFQGRDLYVVGHSFGSYVAAEIAEQMGGVDVIVGLDPAADVLGGYNSDGGVSFSQFSQYSWAFHDSNLFVNGGNPNTPVTADEAINVEGSILGGSSHSEIVGVFTHLLQHQGDSVGQFFTIDRLVNHAAGPWEKNQYDADGNRTTSGGYEAVIQVDGTIPLSIDYVPKNTPPADDLPGSISPGTGTWIWANPFGNLSKSGSIGSSTEIDLYRFMPDVSGSYVFGTSGNLDSQFRIYTSSGAALTGIIDGAGAGGGESVTQNLSSGSWYYIGVTGYRTSTGNYTLDINGPSLPATNIVITGSANTGSASGTIDYGADLDYLSVTAPAGGSSLSLTVAPSSGFDGYVELYSSSGALLDTINPGGPGTADTATISITGGTTYYIGVSGVSSTATGTYSVYVDFNPDASQLPEISVTGRSVTIANNDLTPNSADGTDYGVVSVGDPSIDHTFTVVNSGTGSLSISGFSLPSGFKIVEPLVSTIVAGGSDTFTVRLETSSVGSFSGKIRFDTNDFDENPYSFAISGTVSAAVAGSVSIANVSIVEGNAGTRQVTFTVTRLGGGSCFRCELCDG